MSSGRPRRGPKIVALVLIWALLGACSDDPAATPEPGPTPGPTPTPTGVSVVEPSPTVVEPTPEPSLADDAPASVTTVEAGTPIEDPAGNLVAVHALGTIPDPIRELGDLDLFGDTEDLLASSTAFLDVSWCSAGPVDEVAPRGGEPAMSVVADADRPLGPPDAVAVRHPLRAPGFVVAEPGECARGWVTVELPGSTQDAQLARYVYTDPLSSSYEPHVLQWELPPATELDAEATADATGVFLRGQVVTFNEGSLRGTTVDLQGWAELIGVESPLAGTRVVGVLVEVCPATEDWPELGLAVDGWNILQPIDLTDRLGADPLAPLSGSCFEDWAEFAVPIGFAPSDFFVADGLDPDVGFALWSLDGAAIAPPS